jgi:hypothetical protein
MTGERVRRLLEEIDTEVSSLELAASKKPLPPVTLSVSVCVDEDVVLSPRSVGPAGEARSAGVEVAAEMYGATQLWVWGTPAQLRRLAAALEAAAAMLASEVDGPAFTASGQVAP